MFNNIMTPSVNYVCWVAMPFWLYGLNSLWVAGTPTSVHGHSKEKPYEISADDRAATGGDEPLLKVNF